MPEDVFWEAYQDLEMENEILQEQSIVLWQVIDSFPQKGIKKDPHIFVRVFGFIVGTT